MKCEARKSSQLSNDINCGLTDYTNGDILDVNSSRSTGDCMFSVGRKFKFILIMILSSPLPLFVLGAHVTARRRTITLERFRTYHVYASGKRKN